MSSYDRWNEFLEQDEESGRGHGVSGKRGTERMSQTNREGAVCKQCKGIQAGRTYLEGG